MGIDYRQMSAQAREKREQNAIMSKTGIPVEKAEELEVKKADQAAAEKSKPKKAEPAAPKREQKKAAAPETKKMGRRSSSSEQTSQKTVRLTKKQTDHLKKLVKTDQYPDESAAVRAALDDFFKL